MCSLARRVALPERKYNFDSLFLLFSTQPPFIFAIHCACCKAMEEGSWLSFTSTLAFVTRASCYVVELYAKTTVHAHTTLERNYMSMSRHGRQAVPADTEAASLCLLAYVRHSKCAPPTYRQESGKHQHIGRARQCNTGC